MSKICKYLIVLMFVYAEGEGSPIQEALQEANKNGSSVNLILLKDYPALIPILAQWQYDDWHPYDASVTVEKYMQEFEKQLTASEIPLMIVAIKDGAPVGSIALYKEGEPEFSDLFDGSPWVDAFHVVPAERNQGLGQELVNAATAIAKRLGYRQLNFYTSVLANVGRYVNKGAEIVETRAYRGHTVTLIKLVLSAPQ
jgi:GNAT superfamily N-acetyltransferase